MGSNGYMPAPFPQHNGYGAPGLAGDPAAMGINPALLSMVAAQMGGAGGLGCVSLGWAGPAPASQACRAAAACCACLHAGLAGSAYRPCHTCLADRPLSLFSSPPAAAVPAPMPAHQGMPAQNAAAMAALVDSLNVWNLNGGVQPQAGGYPGAQQMPHRAASFDSGHAAMMAQQQVRAPGAGAAFAPAHSAALGVCAAGLAPLPTCTPILPLAPSPTASAPPSAPFSSRRARRPPPSTCPRSWRT